MATTPADLFALFDRLGIEHSTIEHPPFFTVEEGRPWHDKIPGLRLRTCSPRTARAAFGWSSCRRTSALIWDGSRKPWAAPRFSFARPDVLQEVLALTPGAVTPFGLINDTQRRVTVILDDEMLDREWVNVHPLHNAASTTVRSSDLLRFIRAPG